MKLFAIRGILGLLLLCICTPARAITVEELPERFYEIVPKAVVLMIPPEILARLTLEDALEFIQAKDCGELYSLREVCVEDWQGLRPEQVQGLLGVMPGFPIVPARFERAARTAYGRGIFVKLEWDMLDNGDGSVDLHLRYKTRRPSGWYVYGKGGNWGGPQIGPIYNDFRLDGEDKQWGFGLLFNGENPEEIGGQITYRDKTLNNAMNDFSARFAVENDFRERLSGLPVESRHRDRTAELDLKYGWNNAPEVEKRVSQWGFTGGAYVSDAFIESGNPYATGLPRFDVAPEGTGAYTGVYWESTAQDKVLMPSEGWKYYFEIQQHFGEWSFNRVRADFRQYYAVDNLLGIEPECGAMTCDGNIAAHFPAASLAVQLQGDISGGHDVPYSKEIRAYDRDYMRGYEDEFAIGTKFIGARAEYRFALDRDRRCEAFVFSDHGWIGEDLDDLEALGAYGAGFIFEPPLLPSAKIGLNYGRSYMDDSDRIGLSFGYSF